MLITMDWNGMTRRTWKSIVDEAPIGSRSVSRSVEDEAPQVHYKTREEYFGYLDSVRKSPHLYTPQEAEDILFGSVEPEETFQEYLGRQAS